MHGNTNRMHILYSVNPLYLNEGHAQYPSAKYTVQFTLESGIIRIYIESGIANLNWQLTVKIRKDRLHKNLSIYWTSRKSSSLRSCINLHQEGLSGCMHILHSSNSALVILRYGFLLRQAADRKKLRAFKPSASRSLNNLCSISSCALSQVNTSLLLCYI
jgi:hypothetical protein